MKIRAPSILPQGSKLLACQVFQPEITFLGVREDEVVFFDQGLHRYPDQLRENLAQCVSKLGEDPKVERVVLAYGYCGGGLEGLSSESLDLVVPLVHDCIPLLLGSGVSSACVECGASFYLSSGWIDHGKTPYSEYFVTREKFGHEEAMWVCKEMLKNYREVSLITTEAGLETQHYGYAQDMASLFGLKYREIIGNGGWLRRLLTTVEGEGFTTLVPGRRVHLGLYPQARPIRPQPSRK